MSALHTAVARAIAYADWQAPPEIAIPVGARHDRMAAVAIRVVLAEAQCAVDALAAPYSANDIDSGHRRSREQYERAVREALAALAALGEQA